MGVWSIYIYANIKIFKYDFMKKKTISFSMVINDWVFEEEKV